VICAKHGKRIATAKDLEEYGTDPKRASCRRHGDCDCPICSAICWAGECDPRRREKEE